MGAEQEAALEVAEAALVWNAIIEIKISIILHRKRNGRMEARLRLAPRPSHMELYDKKGFVMHRFLQ